MKLFDHQSRLVERLRDKPRYYANWACGSGKTIGVLAACADQPMPTLVLAPLSTLHSAWMKDAANFPGLKARVIRGNSVAARKALIQSGADVYITNYDAFKKHAADYLAAGVRRLVIDEAVKVKNPRAAITQKSIVFADRMASVVCLSGYPAPQGPQDWWAQMRCVDRRCLGDSFWSFVSRFAVVQKRKIKGREVVVGFNQTPLQRAALQERLSPWVWSLSKEECLDLPPQTDEILEVEMDPGEAEAYRAAEDELSLCGTRIKAEACLTKLQQITGGGVLVEGEEADVGGSKMGELLDWIGGLPPGEPVVVWAEFRHEIRRLVGRLSVLGPAEALYGETSGDVSGIVRRFRDGPTRFLVAHPACAGHGTDGLQKRCSYAAFYSIGFNSDQHVQARDRIHRSGMGDRPATYVYLLARDTVNLSAFRSLKGKKSRADAITEALRETRGARGANVTR